MSDSADLKSSAPLERNPAGLIGLLLVAAGVMALLGNLVDISLGQYLWPLWVIAPGLLLMIPAARMQPDRPEPLAFLAIPGAGLLTVGLLMLLMNIFDYWQSFAYAWALIPIGVLWGAGYARRYTRDDNARRGLYEARRVMFWIFLAFAAFFELFIFHQPLGQWWPVVVILLGVYLVARNWQRSQKAS